MISLQVPPVTDYSARPVFRGAIIASAVWLLLSLCVDAIAEPGRVEVLEEHRQTGSMEPVSVGAKLSATTLSLQSDAFVVTLPSGEPYGGHIVSVLQPESGLYWSTFRAGLGGLRDPTKDRISNLKSYYSFYVSDQEILGIMQHASSQALWLSRSTTRIDSIEEGRSQTVDQITRVLPQLEDGSLRTLRKVDLSRDLPFEFFFNLHPSASMEAKVSAIDRRPGGWTITLTGRQNRRAEVVLDDLFNLQRAALIGN